MEERWKQDEIERIKNGTSIFQYIPPQIGKVLYCDTTEPAAKPLSHDEVKKRKIWGVLIAVPAVLLVVFFIYVHAGWIAYLIPAVLLFIAFFVSVTVFAGTDYFMGENGCAIVEFMDKRDNITKETVVLFDDISYMFSGETIKTDYKDQGIVTGNNLAGIIVDNLVSRTVGKEYDETEYFFSIYGKTEFNEYPVLYERKGTYSDECPDDPTNPKGVNPAYPLMKAVEKQFASIFFNLHRDDEQVSFAINSNGNIKRDAIIMARDYFIIGERTFDYTNMNQISIDLDDDCLYIEDVVKSKWIDVPDKFEKVAIPLSIVGNRMAFRMFYDYYYGDNVAVVPPQDSSH